MAKFIIGSDVQEPTSSKGNKYKRCKVKDEAGNITEDVAVFSFYSQYNAVVPGATVEGVLQDKEYNGKKSYSLVDGNLGAKPAGMGGGAKAAVAAKAESIKQSQERKEEGIMISSTARMATDVLVAMIAKDSGVETLKNWQKEWLSVRKWFVDNWENTTGKEILSQFEQTYGVKYPEPGVDDINPDDVPF